MGLILKRSDFVSRNKSAELAVFSGTNIPFAGYIFSTMFHHCPFWHPRIRREILHTPTCTALQNQMKNPFPLSNASSPGWLRILHPLLLPVLIMDLETNLALRDDGRWTREINEIEDETGRRLYDSEVVNPLNLDLSSIMQRLNGCSVFLSLIE